jgi:hypothetical protein
MNMKRTSHLLSMCAAFAFVAGCAGQLTEQEQQDLFNAKAGGGGSGGNPTTTTGPGTGGGPAVDMCVVGTLTMGPMHTCQTQGGCHGGTDPSLLSAKLNLDNVNLTTNAKAKYLDVPNAGDPNGVGTPCMAGMAKLIDSTDPMKSLIYTKLVATGETPNVPCGSKMPFVGNMTTDEKACILRWIQSVVALK